MNTGLNDLRKVFILRKTCVSVERISVCKVIGNLVEHGNFALNFLVALCYLFNGTSASFYVWFMLSL